MVGASSFSQPHLCVQPPLESPPNIRLSTSVNFQHPIPPLLVHKIILAIPTNTLFLYTSTVFSLYLPIFPHDHPSNPHQKYFSYLNHLVNSSCVKGQGARESCDDWHCFNLSFLPQSMDSHCFLIAHAQKIGVLHVVVSDEDACIRNGKPSNSPFLIPQSTVITCIPS